MTSGPLQARLDVTAQVLLLVPPKSTPDVRQAGRDLLYVGGDDGIGFVQRPDELLGKRRLRGIDVADDRRASGLPARSLVKRSRRSSAKLDSPSLKYRCCWAKRSLPPMVTTSSPVAEAGTYSMRHISAVRSSVSQDCPSPWSQRWNWLTSARCRGRPCTGRCSCCRRGRGRGEVRCSWLLPPVSVGKQLPVPVVELAL